MSTQTIFEILGKMTETGKNYENGDLDQCNAVFEGAGAPDWEEFLKENDATTENTSNYFQKN